MITCNLNTVEIDRIPFILDIDSRFNLPLTSIKGDERIEVIYGSSNVLDSEILFFSNSKVKVNTYMDSSRPALALRIESIKKSFIDARDRNVKLRYITDIKAENISYCKELMEIAEVRHLDGIKGNFMVSEKEYIAPLSSPGSEVASQIIYSNLWEMVSQQNYIFDTLWNKAVPAVRRFKEIEEGIGPIDTRLLEDSDEIFNHLKHVIENSSKRLLCSKSGAMQWVYNNFFDQYKKIVDMQKRGGGEGIRWITTVNNDNKDLIRLFLNAGVKIRHLRNLPPMNFAIDDKYFHATIENMEDGKMTRSLLTSNEPIYINHYNSIFEELWKNGIEAEQKIRDIEEGADLADIEVFPNAPRTRQVYLDLVEAATKEILFIFPTPNAFTRQSKIGAVGLAEKAAAERDVKVRILMPLPANNLTPDYDYKIDVRYIEQMSETKATILVVDRKESLVMELRDDSKDTFDEAIGLSTYSNSKAGVLSYVAIFDNLWEQTKLYEQIKDSNTKLELANKQLLIQDKAQQEFINIAAHELRTPIQPILGLSSLLLQDKQTENKQQELLEVVFRNAKRLERLTENILDITRIESKSLKLEKEIFNLSELLRDAAADFQNQIDKGQIVSASRKLELTGLEEDILVEADKDRIHQVISNLLSNAIKFTDEGKVSISATKFDDGIVVSVKDTGSGIDSKILPKLFTKFATNSVTGTGLGLFVSKNIIEAHGGQMWGGNNANEKGAAFYFSLPSIKDSKK
jgi:signal transduction histidine kinase